VDADVMMNVPEPISVMSHCAFELLFAVLSATVAVPPAPLTV
jgi:hypothetical protein